MTKRTKTTLRKFSQASRRLNVNCPNPSRGPYYGPSTTVNAAIKYQSECSRMSSMPSTSQPASELFTSPTLSTMPTPLLQPSVSFPLDPALVELNAPIDGIFNDRSNEGSCDPVQMNGGLVDSIQEMNMLSYEIRDRIQKEYLSDTTTRRQYEKYVKDYVDWWNRNEFELFQQSHERISIPALPVTPAKVVLFLNYTIKRPRCSIAGAEIPGTTVGHATIQSTINALEWERSRNAHLYPNDADVKISLRSDDRIKKIESASKHNQPFRIMLSQMRKAAGTSADTYTREQMLEISLNCLEPRHSEHFDKAIRDRALYLVPLSTAFRGDNVRSLGLSDLFSKPIINVGVRAHQEIMCLRILCDNAKHNQCGKVEEQGAIRHHLVELCSIGALALHFFVQFHLSRDVMYDWTSDFSPASQKEGYGIYGRREWQQYKVFPGEGKIKPMTYQNHAKRIHKLHTDAGVTLSKTTHAQRYSAAFVMRSHGTAKEEACAIGWSCQDAYNAVYDRELPVEALLGAAMYNARKPDSHFCARASLQPPVEIMSQIFPWVEEELQALKTRTTANALASDKALEGFLGLLKDMRLVLVQDLAVLYQKVPNSHIYSCSPFNGPVFQEFAANASALLEQSETNAQLALQNLPQEVAQMFEGALQLLYTKQQETEERQMQKIHSILEAGLARMQANSEYLQTAAKPHNKRRKTNSKTILPIQTNANTSANIDSTQPIRSMFTAPIIPTAISYRSQQIEEETTTGYDGEPLPTIIPRPPNTTLSVSTSVNTIPEALQEHLTSSIPLPQLGTPSHDVPQGVWWSDWLELTKQYNVNRLLKHTWDWEQNHLVPHYSFQKLSTFDDLWKEYTEGLNGYLPFREIKERWAANPAWHRGDGTKKNEFTR